MKIEIDCTESEGDEFIRDIPPGAFASGHLETQAVNEVSVGGVPIFTVAIHLNITLNLTPVAILAFTSWLVRRAKAVKGCSNIKVDGHYFPVDKTDTPKLIADKIQHEQQKQKK